MGSPSNSRRCRTDLKQHVHTKRTVTVPPVFVAITSGLCFTSCCMVVALSCRSMLQGDRHFYNRGLQTMLSLAQLYRHLELTRRHLSETRSGGCIRRKWLQAEQRQLVGCENQKVPSLQLSHPQLDSTQDDDLLESGPC